MDSVHLATVSHRKRGQWIRALVTWLHARDGVFSPWSVFTMGRSKDLQLRLHKRTALGHYKNKKKKITWRDRGNSVKISILVCREGAKLRISPWIPWTRSKNSHAPYRSHYTVSVTNKLPTRFKWPWQYARIFSLAICFYISKRD